MESEWCERFDSGLREFHHLRNLADNGKYKLPNSISTKTEAYKPNMNLSTGQLKWTGNEYHVPSPNFVCCVEPVDPSSAG